MKILMVSSFLPYPLINGGNVRLFNLLKNLSKEFEITLICEKRDFQTQRDVDTVKKYCKKVLTVDRKKQWTIGNILKAGFSLNPFLITGHTLPEMKRAIREELKNGEFELIHIETFYVMQNLPRTDIPTILVEHNVEYLVYKRFAQRAMFFLKPFLNWDVWKMKRIEESFWKKADLLVAVSDKEAKIMNTKNIVPNGVDINEFRGYASNYSLKQKRILFIGDFKWLENRDSVKWILKTIWPQLKSKLQNYDIKLWIVGKKIPESIKKLVKDKDVIFDENAPRRTSLIYKRSFILLSPIRVGGGTSFKILEAMASGVPVITTTLGKEGITKGNEVIIANTTEEVIESVIKLFTEKGYYENILQSARKLIEENYDWRNITKELERVYEKVAKV